MTRIFLCVVLLPVMTFSCSFKPEEKSAIDTPHVNEYPDLLLKLDGGKEVSTKTLEGKNIFIFFQPECDHCQEEAILIEQRLEEFNGYTLYFISSGTMENITAFARNFKLDNKSNVKFAWTSTEGVLNHYGPIQTPSVYIYAEGKLKQSFNGQTEIETILDAL